MVDRAILNRVRELMVRVLRVSPASISDNSQLLGFGIDSIRVIELVATLEEEFAINVNPGDLAEVTTVLDLATFVERVRHKSLAVGDARQDR